MSPFRFQGQETPLRLLDFIYLDPRTLRASVHRRGASGREPMAHRDGKADFPFCAAAFLPPEQKALPLTLLREAILAFTDSEPSVVNGPDPDTFAVELTRRSGIDIDWTRDLAGLQLSQEGGAKTAPAHRDVLAFQPTDRQIAFARDGRRLTFFGKQALRTAFARTELNPDSIGLVIQEAIRLLFGLVAMPILEEPTPETFRGWKCYRLIEPPREIPAIVRPTPAPPTTASRRPPRGIVRRRG